LRMARDTVVTCTPAERAMSERAVRRGVSMGNGG
jgi:hypothetical protein